LDELQKKYEEDKKWISSTGLDEHGISNTVGVCEVLLQRYADTLCRKWIREGYNEEGARALVEKEVIRQGKNSVGNRVWQIRRNKLQEFRHWLVEEGKFVNVTDAARLIGLNVSSTRHGLTHILPDLQEKEISYRVDEGASHADAAISVEKTCCRMGYNSSGENVWQFHEDFVPAVIHRLEFISAHNAKAFRQKYGITAHINTTSKAIENIYYRHLESSQQEVASGFCARREVEQNIAVFGVSRKGNCTWLIHPDYIDELKAEIPRVTQEEKKWTSASRLPKHHINVRPHTANLALAYLFESKVKSLVSSGKTNDEAKAEISSNAIRLSHPDNKAPLWEIHESFLGELRDLLASPRESWIEAAWKIARRDARLALHSTNREGNPISTLQDRMESGREAHKRTWVERVVPSSKDRLTR